MGAHNWGEESKIRAFAHYRLRGMMSNLKEIPRSTPLSEMEREYLSAIHDLISELDAKWGTVRWDPLPDSLPSQEPDYELVKGAVNG